MTQITKIELNKEGNYIDIHTDGERKKKQSNHFVLKLMPQRMEPEARVEEKDELRLIN